jgi:signal transduction histidine kinase
MSPQVLRRIFEPFFTTKEAIGTGLGLWVSAEIVSKHKGRIRVRSRVRGADGSGGAVFMVFFPMNVERSAVTEKSAENDTELRASGSPDGQTELSSREVI